MTEARQHPGAAARRRPLAARLVAAASWAYLAVVVGCWLLLYLTDLWWPATFLAFAPRWLLAGPLVVLVPAAAWWRRPALIVLALAGLLVVGPVMGLCIPWGRLAGGPPPGPRLRVLTCNMHYKKYPDSSALDDLVAAAQPDVVALQEWLPQNQSAVLGEKSWHRHRALHIFLASRYPILRTTELGGHSGSKKGLVRRYDLDTPAGVVAFFSLHLASPRQGLFEAVQDSERGAAEIRAGSDLRWLQSRQLAAETARVGEPLLLAGDFNTPPQSALFRDLWGGYTDAFAAAGWGWGYTFHASHTLVRIDHVLAGPGWSCERCWVGPDLGSPHRPVIADLVWRGASPALAP
jgi:endonuclease/exonuclease/phosphatase family metal-dependent hydrolase